MIRVRRDGRKREEESDFCQRGPSGGYEAKGRGLRSNHAQRCRVPNKRYRFEHLFVLIVGDSPGRGEEKEWERRRGGLSVKSF